MIKSVVLTILDGWGIAPPSEKNPFTIANTPNIDKLIREYPVMSLKASGEDVGLLSGQPGSARVGHLNMGAGRIIFKDLPKINKAIEDESFFKRRAFVDVIEHVKTNKSALHIIGMLDSGNLHASEEHCYALLELAKGYKVKDVFVHVILDGVDTSNTNGLDSVKKLGQAMEEIGIGKIASISGRKYAMDRNNDWQRTEKYYRVLVGGEADELRKPIDVVQNFYEEGIYDNDIPPSLFTKKGLIEDSDGVIFFNFRGDRLRQFLQALSLPGFSKFKTKHLKYLQVATMTEYIKEFPVKVAFCKGVIENSLPKVLANKDLKQIYISDTEKHTELNYFFKGKNKEELAGFENKTVDVAKVSCHSEFPEMSASAITKEVMQVIHSGEYKFIVCNFSNLDAVCRSDNFEATVKAVEVIDRSLGKIVDHALARDGVVIVTSSHGRVEDKFKNKNQLTASLNPVPFMMVGPQFRGEAGLTGDPIEGDLSLLSTAGNLSDVAPTILRLLEIKKPNDMLGRELV